jgi:hypothetical protein
VVNQEASRTQVGVGAAAGCVVAVAK